MSGRRVNKDSRILSSLTTIFEAGGGVEGVCVDDFAADSRILNTILNAELSGVSTTLKGCLLNIAADLRVNIIN